MAENKTYYTQMVQKIQNPDGTTVNANIMPITDGGAVDVYKGEEKQTLQDIVDSMSDFAFKDSVPEASTSSKGIVELANDLADDSTKAATIASVKKVDDSVVHSSNDETINGTKTFTDGINVNGAILQTSYDESTDTRTLSIRFN